MQVSKLLLVFILRQGLPKLTRLALSLLCNLGRPEFLTLLPHTAKKLKL